ncbi:helix-turn-helix domain-containing protein [Cryobacterium fucosi]|uniref:XRE family transcriptional regulator n=1 Tax=Cryobacterium fucosi TaxID=1259157 RepID=A0A4R9AWL9_9MICO|nr:helix-turn-helix transcriptional regulator [Cryobacterium fucosi]TFD70421.1 XRE family transcriptional regulator [Cryobacterium fucosi]
MSATILASAARAASGLSQTELAVRSGIAGSSLSLIEHGKREPTFATLESLLRATRHSVVTIPTVRSDAARIAADIRRDLVGSDDASSTDVVKREASAFRRFLQLADNLQAERGATRVGLTLTEPASTGSAHWDAAIAALCEYRLSADALPVPDWVFASAASASGSSSALWAPRTSEYDIPVDETAVPAEFLRRGILIEAATLESV